MARRRTTKPAPESPEPNRVVLTGRVTTAPAERELPSGDVITTFRVSVPRTRTPMSGRSATKVDWMDCVTAAARCRRSVAGWQVGDAVTVEGVLRRRFYRSPGGGSTVEIEVLRARRAQVR